MKNKSFPKIVIASHNKDKIKEIEFYLKMHKLNSISAAKLNVSEPKETERSFAGNALLKATHSCQVTGLPALGDDSGLVIPALNGAPGIFSARWGGPKKDFNLAMNKVNIKMKGKEKFAWFVSCLAIVFPNEEKNIFEGRVYGNISWPPKGKLGFGYDPIFIPLGYKKTFGQMEESYKNKISHRYIAFKQFFEKFL